MTHRAYAVAARLASATAVLMFALVVVGSVVRTTNSGLACPDWPLCHGRLIPPMQFNVLIEWFHRLLALCVSLLLAATVGWILFHPETRSRFGGLAALAVALLATQVLLGALTVWRLLDPAIVSGHLAVALLLFGTMLTLALGTRLESGTPRVPNPPRPAGLLPMAAGAILFIFAQSVLGGMVSTNHASLVCPDWPTCRGEWFPPLEGLVGLQMTHRFGAYLLGAYLVGFAVLARRSGDPALARAGTALVAMVFVQMAIGVANVFMGIPVWVSALHLGNAAALLAVAIRATFRAAALPPARSALRTVTAS